VEGRRCRGLCRLLFTFYIKKKFGMLGGRRSRGLYRLPFNFYIKTRCCLFCIWPWNKFMVIIISSLSLWQLYSKRLQWAYQEANVSLYSACNRRSGVSATQKEGRQGAGKEGVAIAEGVGAGNTKTTSKKRGPLLCCSLYGKRSPCLEQRTFYKLCDFPCRKVAFPQKSPPPPSYCHRAREYPELAWFSRPLRIHLHWITEKTSSS